jgi:hypothetical protein
VEGKGLQMERHAWWGVQMWRDVWVPSVGVQFGWAGPLLTSMRFCCDKRAYKAGKPYAMTLALYSAPPYQRNVLILRYMESACSKVTC